MSGCSVAMVIFKPMVSNLNDHINNLLMLLYDAWDNTFEHTNVNAKFDCTLYAVSLLNCGRRHSCSFVFGGGWFYVY